MIPDPQKVVLQCLWIFKLSVELMSVSKLELDGWGRGSVGEGDAVKMFLLLHVLTEKVPCRYNVSRQPAWKCSSPPDLEV